MNAARAAIPYSGSTIIALDPEHFAAIERTLALLFRIAHSQPFQQALDAERSSERQQSRSDRPGGRERDEQ